MKKLNLKSVMVGVVIGAVLTSSVALAANWTSINVVLNQFRVKTGSSDIVQWGDTYTLGNGTQTAGSIVYNDTTYLPIRKVAEATGMNVAWNSISNTVTVFDNGMFAAEMVEKPDANGIEWAYNILDAGTKGYLQISSQDTQDERAYEMISSNSYRYDTDGIMFASFVNSVSVNASKSNPYAGYNLYNISKILFNSDKNSQDGNVVYTIKTPNTGIHITDLYFLNSTEVIYTTDNFEIIKYNLATGDSQTLYTAPSVTYSSGPGFSYGYGKLYITKFENNEVTFVIERDAGETGRKDITSWQFDINLPDSSLAQLW